MIKGTWFILFQITSKKKNQTNLSKLFVFKYFVQQTVWRSLIHNLLLIFHFLVVILLLFAGNIKIQVQASVSKKKEQNWTEINNKYATKHYVWKILSSKNQLKPFVCIELIWWVWLLTRLTILYGYGFYRQWIQSARVFVLIKLDITNLQLISFKN